MELPRDCEGCMAIVNAEGDPHVPYEQGDDTEEKYIRRLMLEEIPWNYWLLRINHEGCKTACLDGIAYILQQRESMELSYETAYLTMMYLTQYLRFADYNDELFHRVNLISVTCLVLAVKWESRSNVIMAEEWGEGDDIFRTTDYCTDGYTFSAQEICDMELVILHKLDHRMGFTTPFHYTDYFASKFFYHSFAVIKIEETISSALRHNSDGFPNSESALELMRQRSSVVVLEAIIHSVAAANGQLRQEAADSLRNRVRNLGLDVDNTPAELLVLMEEVTDLVKEAAGKWLTSCKGCMSIVNAENDPLCPNEHGVDNDDEYIRRLIREEIPRNNDPLRVTYKNWIKPACSDGIAYILKRQELLKLRLETAYLAIMYLTQYLSKVVFTEESFDEVKLISVTCLVLAVKWDKSPPNIRMSLKRKVEDRTFSTARYCTGSYIFSREQIFDMEVMILRKFDHKMGLTTAFHYTHYFVKRIFSDSDQKCALADIEHTIISALRRNSETALVLMQQRSSVVAMSAVIHMISLYHRQPRLTTTEDLRPLANELGVDIDDTPTALLELGGTQTQRQILSLS